MSTTGVLTITPMTIAASLPNSDASAPPRINPRGNAAVTTLYMLNTRPCIWSLATVWNSVSRKIACTAAATPIMNINASDRGNTLEKPNASAPASQQSDQDQVPRLDLPGHGEQPQRECKHNERSPDPNEQISPVVTVYSHTRKRSEQRDCQPRQSCYESHPELRPGQGKSHPAHRESSNLGPEFKGQVRDEVVSEVRVGK